MRRVLTPEQIAEAKTLRLQLFYTKRDLARHFGVGGTTIWENVFARKRREKRIYLYRRRERLVCTPCAKCEICLTRVITGDRIPLGFQIGDVCIQCYLQEKGLTLMDVAQQGLV